MGRHLDIAAVIFVLAAILWGAWTKGRAGSWSDASRMAAIQSLVERGTWQIDGSDFARTGDKVFINGHFYSDKPPLLQFLAAQVYAVLHRWLGADLADRDCAAGEVCAYKWLTILVIGLSSAPLLAAFYWFSVRLNACFWRSLLATGLLMLGTTVWPYSVVFNNHLPAAAALFVGFLLLVWDASRRQPETEKRSSWLWRPFFGGLLLALAATFDLSAAFIAVPILLWAGARVLHSVTRCRRRAAVWLVAVGSGVIIPVLLTAMLNYQITGSVLPAYLRTEGYHYAGSQFGSTVAGNVPSRDIWRYALDAFVGYRGLFAHSPVLLWGLAGLAIVLLRRGHPLRWPSLFMAVGAAAQVAYILTHTDNFGGWAYSMRWFGIWVPLLMFYAPPALPARWSWSSLGSGALLTVASALSVLSSCQGMFQPWLPSRPPVYLAFQGAAPYVQVNSYIEADVLKGPTAWARLALCPRWTMDDLSDLPQPPDDIAPLQANFDNRVMLMGYDLADEATGPAGLSLTLHWQPITMLWEDFTQSVRMFDAQGQEIARSERPIEHGESECWRWGEIIVDHHQLPVPERRRDGQYYVDVSLREDGVDTPSLPLAGSGESVVRIRI